MRRSTRPAGRRTSTWWHLRHPGWETPCPNRLPCVIALASRWAVRIAASLVCFVQAPTPQLVYGIVDSDATATKSLQRIRWSGDHRGTYLEFAGLLPQRERYSRSAGRASSCYRRGWLRLLPNRVLRLPQELWRTGSTMQSRPVPGIAVQGSSGSRSGDSSDSAYESPGQNFGSTTRE